MQAADRPEAAHAHAPFSFFDKCLIWLLRNSPLGRGKLRRALAANLTRKAEGRMIASRLGDRDVFLCFDNLSDVKAYLGPTRYMRKEVKFIADCLPARDGVFIDVGANTGLVSVLVGRNKLALRSVLIEPNSKLTSRILRNFGHHRLSDAVENRIHIVQVAVSDREDVMTLDLSEGIGTAHVVPNRRAYGLRVKTRPLAAILADEGVSRIDAMKIDIEGHEDVALPPFLDTWPAEHLPRRIVMEVPKDRSGLAEKALEAAGYHRVTRTRANVMFERRQGEPQ